MSNLEVVRRQGVSHLVHFTNAANIPSIMEHGLLTRSHLNNSQIPYQYNDEKRLDNNLSSISLSVSYHNYRMFYSLTLQNKSADWAILWINPAILDTDKAYFYTTNAASSRMTGQTQRNTPRAFLELFGDLPYMTRSCLGIPPKYTTDPQAEILYTQNISPKSITNVTFQNAELFQRYKDPVYQKSGGKPRYDAKTFGPRQDYQFWKSSS